MVAAIHLSTLNLKGDSGIGIRPIVAILEKFPYIINARWLLIGEGMMVSIGIDKAKAYLMSRLHSKSI